MIGRQSQEAELHLLFGMGGHEGAFALPAHEEVFSREFVNRLAHRALADLETGRQLEFARDGLARTPLTGLQAAQDEGLDLLVQRAEGRAGCTCAHACRHHGVGH